jgi:hypothetical protein
VQFQLDWKLRAPYAVRRALTGLDGLVAFYRDYRVLTDGLYCELDIPKISIDSSEQEWEKYEEIIDRVLMSPQSGLPTA